MLGTVISSRAGERSGNTWSSRPVARSPTIAVPSGSTASPVGTASPEATRFGSPASCPDSGFAGSPGAGTAGVSVGGPTSGGLPWGNGRNGPAGVYPPSPQPASSTARRSTRTASRPGRGRVEGRLTPITVRARAGSRAPVRPPAGSRRELASGGGQGVLLGSVRACGDPGVGDRRPGRDPARPRALDGARRDDRGALAADPRAPGQPRRRPAGRRRRAGAGLGAPRRGKDPGRLPGRPPVAAAGAAALGRSGAVRRPAARGRRPVQRTRGAHPGDGGVGRGGRAGRAARPPRVR